MKASLISLLGAAVLPASLAAPSGIVMGRDAVDPGLMTGKYIIQLKPGTAPEAVTAHHTAVRSLLRRRDGSAAASEVDKMFQIGDSFNAYSGSFDDATLVAIAELEEVLTVEPDSLVYIERQPVQTKRALTTQSNSIWSLGDLSHREAGATEYVYDETAGQGMTAYVVDSGIRLSHDEFEGRARFGINGLTGSTEQNGSNSDTEGHGTHVAATIAGKTYGVAKKASVVDVKVFDGDTGSISAILTGITWAVDDIVSKGAQETSVLNLSLSGTGTAIDNAVLAAYQQGVLSVVAAGNDNQPTTNVSPAKLPQSFTVGMTQPDRGRVNIIEGIYGSNYGPELDVFAPGRDIVSASHTSDIGTATKTGTSMAAPLVAGLVCYLRALEAGLGTPDAVTDRILELAVPDVVGDPKGSPNLLVNNGSGR